MVKRIVDRIEKSHIHLTQFVFVKFDNELKSKATKKNNLQYEFRSKEDRIRKAKF